MGEGERLGLLINQLKTNAFQFSKHANIAQGSVSNIINGKRRMSREIIDAIMKFHPEANIEWILRGVGNMFHEIPKDVATPGEKYVDAGVIKSTISLLEDGLPDEERMKAHLSENLKTAAAKWKMTQLELMELLGGNVTRQGVNTYFRGDTLPRLPLLLRFERVSGWPLVELVGRALSISEFPAAPLVKSPLVPVQLSAAQVDEMRDDMNKLKLRLARFIKKIEKQNGDK